MKISSYSYNGGQNELLQKRAGNGVLDYLHEPGSVWKDVKTLTKRRGLAQTPVDDLSIEG